LTAFFTGIRPYSGISRKELASRTISIADLGYDFLGAGSIHLPKMMTYRQLIIIWRKKIDWPYVYSLPTP
jgi:hypothetical protein